MSVLASAIVAAGTVVAQPVGIGSPNWNTLPPAERQVLAPLAPEWDKLDAQRKQKWRGIAQRYPNMSAEQQQRLRQQMSTWSQLSPAERQSAREQYKSLRSLPPEKKEAVRRQWEQYQNLPPEKKQELATRPPPSGPPQSRAARPPATMPPPPPPPNSALPPRRRSRIRLPDEVHLTPGAEPAPLARRYAALGYEGLLLSAIVLVVGFLTLPAMPAAGPGGVLAVPPLSARVLAGCLVFGAAGLYFAWSWTGGRRTLPMKTWRLALIRADGRSVDARTAVIRYFGAWIGPVASLAAHAALQPANLGAHAAWLVAVGYVWPIVDPDRQFLHDRIAGTRIVMATPDPSSASPTPRPR